MNYSKTNKLKEDRKIHYQTIKSYFKNQVKDKKGYYTKNIDEIKQDITQREMWDLYKSCLDDLIKNNPKITSVIDVGCGMGHITLELCKYKNLKNIVGIDFLRDTFNLTRENKKIFQKVSFIEGNLLNLPFTDSCYDITLCLNTLHHIHPKDFKQSLSEIARVTKKYLILEIRYKYNIFNFWYQYLVAPNIYKNLPTYVNSYRDVDNQLKKLGFKIDKIYRKKQFVMACRRLILLYKKT